MKKITALLLALAMSLSLCACGQSGSNSDPSGGSNDTTPVEPVVLRVSMAESATDNKAVAIEKVAANIEERTEGRVVLEMYPNGQLGSFQEDVESITQGSNIVDGTSPAAYCDYGCPDMMALDLMKMIQTPEECDALNQSELFADMCKQLEEASGIKVLGINWPNQPRCVLSTKPVNSVEDLDGMIIRVPGANYVSFFTRLGCSTVSMTMADTYTALSQGAADACEFPLSTIYSNSLYEVAKYCYLSEHTYAPSMWCMNADIFYSLSEADQQVVLEEFYEGGKEFAKMNTDSLADFKAKLEAEGVTFVEPSEADNEIMSAAAVASAEDFPELSDGIIDEVIAALGRA